MSTEFTNRDMAAQLLDVLATSIENSPHQFGGNVHIEDIGNHLSGSNAFNINMTVAAPAGEVIGSRFESTVTLKDFNTRQVDATEAVQLIREIAEAIRSEGVDSGDLGMRIDRLAECAIPVAIVEVVRLAIDWVGGGI